MLELLLLPFRAVLVAMLGLWLAWSWYVQPRWWLPLVVVFGAIIVAHVCAAVGRRLLPGQPVVALLLMEVWIVAPLMWAALAGCAVVITAVALHVEQGTPTVDEQLTNGLAAAITTFLTSGFIAWAGDQDKSPVARRIKRSFETAFQGVHLAPEVERLVYSDAVQGIEGWSLRARFERATRLARATKVKKGAQRPAASHVSLADALSMGPPPAGNLAVPIFARGSLAVEMYQPKDSDRQPPHGRDEIYLVARGSSTFFDGTHRYQLSAGSFIFVAAGQPHRFESFSSDFASWVFFYGPVGGEKT